MESNSYSLLKLASLLEAAIKEANNSKAEAYFSALDKKLRSLSQEQLAAEEEEFTMLNSRLIELTTLFYEQRESLKQQLSQYKVNTKKLKAYSK